MKLAAALPARLRLPRVRLPSLSPRMRRRLLAATIVATFLGALYMLWLRDSSFVRVESVTVSGLSTDDAGRLSAALEAQGKTMTTLHVRQDDLEEVVQGYPAVRAIEVDSDFPRRLHVKVIEWQPVAIAVAGSTRVAVGAEGGLLKGVPLGGRDLPEVKLDGGVPAAQLAKGAPLRAVSVLAGAPAALRPKLAEATEDGERGIVIEMRDGPELVFGDAASLAAKWEAAARVLADQASKGAAYVDLRLPDRPVAGGLPPEQAAPHATEAETAVPPVEEAAPVTPEAAPVVPEETAPVAPEPTTPVVPEETAPVVPEPQP